MISTMIWYFTAHAINRLTINCMTVDSHCLEYILGIYNFACPCSQVNFFFEIFVKSSSELSIKDTGRSYLISITLEILSTLLSRHDGVQFKLKYLLKFQWNKDQSLFVKKSKEHFEIHLLFAKIWKHFQ